MVKVVVYMEGGGDTKAQAGPLRDAARAWIEAAVPTAKKKVRVVACGGRQDAYEAFCIGLDANEDAFCMLLVDAEELVTAPSRWAHVKQRTGDGWDRPDGTSEDNLHFMAVVMETWLVADPDALSAWFKAGFNPKHLPGHKNLEQVVKADVYRGLDAATRPSQRGPYGKGKDFALLGRVTPARVLDRCPLAGQFVNVLAQKV